MKLLLNMLRVVLMEMSALVQITILDGEATLIGSCESRTRGLKDGDWIEEESENLLVF